MAGEKAAKKVAKEIKKRMWPRFKSTRFKSKSTSGDLEDPDREDNPLADEESSEEEGVTRRPGSSYSGWIDDLSTPEWAKVLFTVLVMIEIALILFVFRPLGLEKLTNEAEKKLRKIFREGSEFLASKRDQFVYDVLVKYGPIGFLGKELSEVGGILSSAGEKLSEAGYSKVGAGVKTVGEPIRDVGKIIENGGKVLSLGTLNIIPSYIYGLLFSTSGEGEEIKTQTEKQSVPLGNRNTGASEVTANRKRPTLSTISNNDVVDIANSAQRSNTPNQTTRTSRRSTGPSLSQRSNQ